MSRSNAPIGHPGPPIHPASAQRPPQSAEAFAQQQQYAQQTAAGQWPPATNAPQQPQAAAYGHAHGNAPAPQHPSQDFYYPQQQAAPQPAPHSDPRYAQPSYAQQPAPQQAAPQQLAAQWPPQTDPRAQARQQPAVDAARYFAQAPQGQPTASGGQPDPARTQRQFAAQPAPQAAGGPVNSLPPQRNYQPQAMPQAQAPQWASDPRMGEPSLDFGHYGAQGGTGQQQQPVARRPAAADQHAYQQQQPQHHHQQQPANQAYAEEEEYEEEFVEEEPRRGRRGLLVVAALVGAIGLGGSMAYVYKTYGKSFASGSPPIVKAEVQPAKTKPAAPGGKEFPNADRKIFGRLGEDAAQGTQTATIAPSQDAQADGAPRKVQTIAIAPPSAAGPTVSVPGMAIENVGPPPGARGLPPIIPQQQPAQAAQKAAPKTAPAPVPAPVVVAAAPPPPPAAATVAAAEIVPAPRKPAPRPKTNDALTSPAAPAGAVATAAVAAPPAAATGANGFVAVLSSQKSRLDALKVYADIQQKFGQVLSNKPADVQEANLGDKGVYYRAVVGPPGSRDAASTLCGQLKAAGFAGCWVTAY